jgi:hypothetical protein
METADFLERIAVELHEIHTTINCRMDVLDDVFVPDGDSVQCCVCRFGYFERPTPTSIAKFGLCRRYAPRPTDEPHSMQWPSVRPTDSCGDGQLRPGAY